MPADLLPVLTGAGVAGVWVLTYLLGWSYTKAHVEDLREELTAKDAAILELKAAVTAADQRATEERRRGDAAVEAAQTSNILLAGIRKGITGGD